ncbi:hypothetical protein [Nocardia colli]|uniref:hypothetical protein n=1 Tax=Nocardia colli TaxID=2545717 RepID=UPI0035D9C828
MTTDDGYMISRNKKAVALITVPGQHSTERDAALHILFNPGAHLDGVIFLASAGYDHIWNDTADLVASALRTSWSYDIAGLRRRNFLEEDFAFQEVCKKLAVKCGRESERSPSWFLTLVNKADLYWNDLSDVQKRYLPGCGSSFDQHREDLFASIGTSTLSYFILPVTSEISPYRFRPSAQSFEQLPCLGVRNMNASLHVLADNMKELADG